MSEVTRLENIKDIDLTVPVLIEASAGTGKTYTLEELFIRMLQEDDNLQIENILVVTFTKAAAAELRTRLHARLLKARRDARKNRGDITRWDNALLAFDQASITTIHGFCERVLSEFAFEGGFAFDAELTDKNDDKITDEMVLDFWRREMYSGKVSEELIREAGLFSSVQIEELTKKSLSKPLAKIAQKRDSQNRPKSCSNPCTIGPPINPALLSAVLKI